MWKKHPLKLEFLLLYLCRPWFAVCAGESTTCGRVRCLELRNTELCCRQSTKNLVKPKHLKLAESLHAWATDLGKKKKSASLDYSGPGKKKRDLKKARRREPKRIPMPQSPEGQLKALDTLVQAGFAEKLTRCSACGWSLGAHFVHGGKHVYRRCINMDCRRRHNMLLSDGWLKDVQRMSLSPMLYSCALGTPTFSIGAW